MTRSSPVLTNASPLPLALHASQARNLQEVLAEINRNPPGEVAIARAHRAIVDGTTESTYRQNTLREIQKLSQTVLEIEQRFATISNLVRTFDSRQAIRDENDRPVQFFPEWNEYHQLYVSLLHGSQTTATQLKMKIDDLLSNLIPLIYDPYVTLADKRRELTGFIEDLDEFQTRGSDKAREFQQLREKIKNFKSNLLKEIKQGAADARTRLKALSIQIEQIEGELEALSGFFAACWSVFNIPTVLGSVSLSAELGSLAGLIALAPVASAALVVGGIAALGYGIHHGLDERAKEMQEKRDKILLLQFEEESLKGRKEDLREMSGEMIRLGVEFNEVINRLGAMQQIWTMIRSDAVGLQEAMNQLRNARTDAGFIARVKNVEKLWHTLAWALDNYALGVAPV